MRVVLCMVLVAGCGGKMAAPPTIDITDADGGDAATNVADAHPDGGAADATAANDATPASDARTDVTTPADAGSCTGSSTSNLDGVSLSFPTAPCRYTQSEVAAGIKIPYEVVVSKNVAGVHPTPNDEGACEQPGPSGLVVSFAITGVGQNYCLCDMGLCPATTFSTAPATGRYPSLIDWDGKNWRGPSDVPSPKGPAFPPDSYEVKIFAKGTRDDGAGGATAFEVRATRTITITPDP